MIGSRSLFGKEKQKVLGWQYSMIYLGGDPYNEKQAVVTARTLLEAIVIRAQDQSEETFSSVMIPYSLVTAVKVMDEETGRIAAYKEKTGYKDVFSVVMITYKDGGQENTIRLRMSETAENYKNSLACLSMMEYIEKRRTKKTK